MTMYRGFQSFGRKNNREKSLLQKAVLTFMMTGVVAWPSFSPVYAASTITDSNGTSLINTNDAVHNIYAQQKVNANIGANKFQTFNVDTGNVANMHFRTSNTSTEYFNTLLNFVDNQINIKGTANAICNGKVGGHLYFLSPNGMLVGAGGVINTGALTVLAPTASEYGTLKGLSAASVTKITDNTTDIPLNPSGTIVVQGTINTTDGVNLRAGQIYVGTDGKGKYSKAEIKSGVTTAFPVNLDGQATMDGELTAVTEGKGDIELVADVQLKNVTDTSGTTTALAKIVVDGGSVIDSANDVTIMAKVENNVSAVEFKDPDGNTKYVVNGEIMTSQPNSTMGFMKDRSNKLSAVVEIGKNAGANITAQKDVKIQALVENNFATSMLGGGDTFGLLTEVPAMIYSFFSSGIDGVFGFLESSATVEIGQNTTVHSVAGDVDIKAQAKNNLKLGANVSALNILGSTNTSKWNIAPSGALTIGSSKTDATVKVDGTVTADAGQVDIEALGDNTFDGSAVIGAGYGGLEVNQACVAVAVDAGWGHNNVKVEIGEHANITAHEDLAVRATAKNAITSTSKIKSSEKNDVAFIVDVLDYDSSAEVDVAGDLTSNTGNLYVTATDDFTKNSLYASAWGGATGLLTTLFGHDSNDNSLLLKAVEPFLRLVAGKLPGEYFDKFNKYGFSDQGAQGEKTALQQILDKFKVGVSVGVMDEDNRAVVNIAKTANLKAAQKVDLHARVYHHELTSRVAGSATVSSTRQDTAAEGVKIMAGGAILIRDVDNTAEVVLEGRDDGKTENISGSSVSITAQTRIESHNVQSKIDAFQDLFGIQMNEEEFKNQFRGQGMDEEDLNAIWLAYKNYKDLVSTEFFVKDDKGNVVYEDGLPKVKPEYQDEDGSKNQELYEKMKTAMEQLQGSVEYQFLSNLLEGKDATYTDSHGVQHTIPGKDSPNSFIGKSKQLFSKIKNVVMDVVDAISLESWVDFNVGAAVSHVYKGEEENPKFAGDFVLGIDDLSNTANVIVGKNNEIQATGDIKLKTDTFIEQSYFDGKLAMLPFFADLVSKMNSAYGLNLMIGLREFDQNSMIVAAENVQFTGQNLTVEADATAKIVGITEYMVTGASTSAIGSVAIALPTFVNNNLISLDDEVKIDVTGEVKLTGKNIVNENLIGGGLVSSGKASGALIVHVYNQERNNLVVIGDNDEIDKLVSEDEKAPELVWTDIDDENNPKQKDTDEERIRKLIAINLLADDSFKKKQGNKDVFDREKVANLFGTANITKDNEITAGSFYSSALNEGEIVTAVADVALSLTGGSLGGGDDGPGFFSKLASKLKPAGNFMVNWVAPILGAPIYWPLVGAAKLGDFFTGNLNSWLPEKPNVPALQYPPDNEVPSVSLTGAGSVNVNTFKVRTASVVDGVKITLTGATVTKDNVTTTVYDFSNIASDATGMVNVAGSAAAGTKGYSKDYADVFNGGVNIPAQDAQDAILVTLSGAAAVGILVNDLTAEVKESEILNAHTFCNEAVRDGHLATSAAAVAFSLSTTFAERFKETKSAALAGGISLNFGDYSTVASLQNNLVTGMDAVPTDLFNLAQTQDIIVTGGIDVDVAKGTATSVGLGAVVSYAAFANDVTAEIKDDGTNDANKSRKYTKMGRVENIARTSLTQAAMAVGIGIALEYGSQAHGATVSLQGAAAVNNIANNVFAVTDGVTIDAQSIQVLAYDYKKGTITMPGKTGPDPVVTDRLQDWEKNSIQLFRNSTSGAQGEGQDNVNHYKGVTDSAETLNEKGNLIITGGLELSLALGGRSKDGGGSAGAAVGVSLIDNNFVADVQNSNITLKDAVTYDTTDTSKITAYPARVLAESNTEKWGIIAGANASRNEGNISVTIGGSILLDFINNDALAKVEKSNIATDGLCLDAYNKEKYVNATGYFSLTTAGAEGRSVGIGLGIVYNKTLNNTAARLLNTDVSAYRPATGSVIGLYADSDTDIYAFAFGAGIANYGLTGNVAVNVGQTNVEAVAEDDGTDTDGEGNPVQHVLKDVKSLTVQSKDNTDRIAIAGNINVSGNGALGVALTWNRVGHQLTADDDILKDFEKKDAQGNVVQTLVPSALSNDEEATQTNRAKLSGYRVVTLENAKVNVAAIDEADFTTISVGMSLGLPIGVERQLSLMVEGANANSMIDKTTLAELVNNTIGKQSLDGGTTEVGSDKITVNVKASTDNKSLSSADVLAFNAGSGEHRAAVGAAVVENTIGANTQANVTGTYNVDNMLVKATSNQDLDNYAFGVEATTDFALGGSVVVNTISGDTSATIGKKDGALSKVISSGSLGVIAESYEELTNGSGQLAASVGGEKWAASGGGSVAVNSISGDTLATIINADVAALGGTGAAAYAHKDSADMKRRLANETLSKPEDYVAPTYTGLIVGADAFHHLNDVTACGIVGFSQAGGISFGIDATVAVDKINGSTKALVTDTDINKGKTSFGDVNVLATDALESYSKVVNGEITLSFAGDFSGNIGAGVLVNNNNRVVQSGIGGTGTHVLNAKDLTVSADSYADVDLLNVCASVAVSGSSGSVVASVTSADVKETTDAYVENMSGRVEDVTVKANHEDDFDFTGTNTVFSISTEYVGIGIGVQVTSQDNKAVTNAAISGSTFEHGFNGVYDDIVKANNTSDTDIFAFNLAVGIGGAESYGLAGVGIGVMVVDNDLEQITLAKVNNSRIGSSDKRADDITVEAVGDMDVNYQSVNSAVGTGGGVGVATVLNGINTTTRADVIGSQLYANNSITVNAEEEKDILDVLATVNGGVIAAIGVPVIHNYIGMDIDTANEYAFVAEAKANIASDDEDKSKKEAALNKIDGETDNSCSGSDIKNLTQQAKNKFKAGNTTTNVVPVEMAKLGVVANINSSTLDAANKVNITTKSDTVSDATMMGGQIGALNVMVPVNRQRIGQNTSVNMGNSTIIGTNGVTISGSAEGKLENHTTEVAVTGVGVLVTTTELTKQENKGISITIGGTTIKTEGNLDISTSDTLSLENHLTQVAVGVSDFGAIVSNTVDYSSNVITLLEGNTFKSNSTTVEADSTPKVSMDNTNVSVTGVRGSGMINKVAVNGNTALSVADGNRIYAKDTVNLGAVVNRPSEGHNLSSDIHAVGVSVLGIGVDKSRTYAEGTVNVDIGYLDFAFLDGSTPVKNVNIYALDGTDIYNYIRTTAVGVIASESNFAQSNLDKTISLTMATGADKTLTGVDNLQVSAAADTNVYAEAKASSGSTIGIMPYAAQVENDMDVDVTLSISGNYVVGAAKFAAEQNSELQLCADALTVTLVGGAGTRTYNDVTFDTTASVTDANITTEKGDFQAYANSMANMNKLGEVDPEHPEKFTDKTANYLVRGNGVGGFDIEVAKGDNKITFNDTLNINNTHLTVAGNTVLGASSGGILRAQLFDYTVNAIGGAQLRLYNTIKSNNIINLTNSEITGTEAEQDVTVAAWDDLQITAATYAEMSAGAAGATEAKTDSTIERKNQLNLQSGKIYGLRDVNLYAGKNSLGNSAMFDFVGRAETYCGALIPFSTNPTLDNTLTQNNEINVASGMNVYSVRHSNLYADHGVEHISLLEARHSMYRDKTNKDVYVATEKGNLADSGETYKNYVKVDGSITAGTSNFVGITIGTLGMFIVADEYEKAMIQGGTGSDYAVYTFAEFLELTTGGLQIEADPSSDITKDKFVLGVDDYVSNLGDRLEQLKKLVSDTEKDSDQTIHNAYVSELDRVVRLKEKMENMVEGQERQLYDAYIVLPDLVASGGNVNVDTGTFYGGGAVTAKGTPTITIDNNTNLELRVQDIIVDDPGGLFNFNDKVISGSVEEIKSAIAEMNADRKAKEGKKSVDVTVTVPSSSKVNDITINGNWAGSAVNYAASDYKDEKGQTVHIDSGTLYAVANVEVNGTVNSKQGDVRITSAHNDIFIESADAEQSANVLGRDVYLSAPFGSITQGFTKGIVSVGGNVQSQFKDLYEGYVGSHQNAENSTSTYTYKDGYSISKESGRISGVEIYINALDININGILQSGYEKYFVNIDSSAQTKINNLKNNNHNSDLSDMSVLGNPKYCVVEGKDVAHGNEGYFDRQIAVYYNPATDNLLVENVDASGGKIYLTGRISSTGSVKDGTGSGAIYCMDGGYNIDVTNSLPYNLKTNTLLVNEVSGLVQFTDIETGVKTQVTRDGIKYYEVSKSGEHKGEEVEISAADAHTQVFVDKNGGYYFKPTSGLKYSWSTGYSLTSYQDYFKEFMAKWWGLADEQKVDNGTLSEWSTDPIGQPVTGASKDRPNGETIGVMSGSNQVSISHNKTEVSEKNTLIDTRRWTTGYLGCHKRWSYTWRKETGTVQADTIMVKADNNVGIKFIGTGADGTMVTVKSTGDGNIVLAGSMGNMEKYPVAGQNYIAEKGKVIVETTKGSITQVAGNIYGAEVDLTAAKNVDVGSIVNGHDLKLSVNVTGGGSIDITAKDRADASVGDNLSNIEIAKLGGTNVDVLSLRADGNIVQLASAPASVADRINLVSGLGSVIGENDTYFRLQGGQQVIGGDSLSASVNVTANKDIKVQQTEGDLRIGKFHTDNGDVYISVPNGGVVDALPYVERTSLEENELLDLWKGMGIIANVNSDLVAEKTEVLKKEKGQGAQYEAWDKDLLLYQLDDAIVNPRAGIKSSEKDPNVFGKNIHIDVKNGVGLNSDTVTEINMEHLDLDKIKFLSQVDPSTVTWKTNDQGESIAVITDRLALGVQQSGVGSISIITAGNANNNNVFVESRRDDTLNLANPYMNLDIAKIVAGTGNVTITSLGSIYDVNILLGNNATGYAAVPTISGGNVMLLAGETGTNNGNIGSSAQYLRLDASGNLMATATGNIYLEQAFADGVAKDLNIVTMTAGVQNGAYSENSGNIYLRAGGNIYGVLQDSRVQGYIRSDSHGEIVLDAYGNIGYAVDADGNIDNRKTLRVKNADVQSESGQKHDSISVRSDNGSINVEGVSTAEIDDDKQQAAGGYLNIFEMSGNPANVVVTLNGDLNLGAAIDLSQTAFVLNVNYDANINNGIVAENIEINATNSINLADGITLQAETVTLNTGKKPVLSYGTIAKSETEGGIVSQGNSENYNTVSGRMNFSPSGNNTDSVFSSTSKIVVNQLKVNASKGVFLGGKNDCNDVVIHNVQESVVYHNVADKESGETADVLTIGISHYNTTDFTSNPVTGTIWVYNEAATETADSGQLAKDMSVLTGVYALGDIDLKSNGNLINLNEIVSQMGGVYLEAGYNDGVYTKPGNLDNFGSIRAENSDVSPNNRVEINATGSLYNHKSGAAGNNVYVYGADGVIISAFGDITNDAMVFALSGDVIIGNNNNGSGVTPGRVHNSGDIYTQNGNVDIYSAACVLNDGDIYVNNEGNVMLQARTQLDNTGRISSKKGYIYLGSDGAMTNQGMIKAEDGYVAIGAKGISNYANIEAKNSIFLLSSDGIYNGEQPTDDSQESIATDIHMYAGDDIVLLPVNGLENRAKLVAGVSGDMEGHGGNVFLDDFEIVNSDIMPQDTKEILQLLIQNYWDQAKTYQSNATVKNSGRILAYKGDHHDGIVYINSQGMTENDGEIYSVNGKVFMGSGSNLTNTNDIHVSNTDITDTIDCNVLLQATGDISNTGSIYVDYGEVRIQANGVVNNGSDDNDANISVRTKGNVYIGSDKTVNNRQSIYSADGHVAIVATEGVDNSNQIYTNGNVFILSNEVINNGVKGQSLIKASENIIICASGVVNNAQILAGHGNGSQGGYIMLGDAEALTEGTMRIDPDTLALIRTIVDVSQIRVAEHLRSVENNGTIFASAYGVEDNVPGNALLTATLKTTLAGQDMVQHGYVVMNSNGDTINTENIYSDYGEVLINSNNNTYNSGNIYVSEEGDVNILSNWNVINTGDIYVKKGTVTLNAVGNADHIATWDAEGITDNVFGVHNTGDIYAEDGDVTIKSATGNVYNTDALNTIKDDDITGASSVVYSQGSIALLAPMGHIENTKALYATKNITIECVDDLYNAPAETSDVPGEYGGHTILRGLEAGAGTDGSGDLKLISHNGVIYNDGILKATRGDVIVDAGGAKVFEDVVFEIDDTICPVPLNGKTKFENESYSIINTKHGDVMVADGNIVIHGQSGVLTLGDMYALHQHVQDFKDPAQSQVDFMKAAGNIEKYATGIAEGKGNISLVSDVGDVFVYSVNEQNEHDSNGHWFLSAQDFTLKATGGYDAQGHEIGGFVYNDKGLKADLGSINMTYGMGVNVGCAIESIHKDVTIKTTRGSAVIASAIKAGSYINLEIGRSADDQDYGKDDVGSLVILDNPETGTSYLQAKDGITMQAADSIFIRDKEGITTNELLRLYAFGDEASDLGGQYSNQAGIFVEGNMTSINGDIDIGLQHGNLTLSNEEGTEIYAIVAHNGMTAVGTHDANITVDNLEGNQVILYTETPEAQANFNSLTVGEKLVLAVNDLDMDMSKVVAYDTDKPFEMNIYTVGNPVDAKIRLDYSKVQTENIEIQQMHVGSAEIITEVPIKIDELSVANRADIRAMGTKTSVYGFMHEYDAENNITYYSEGKGGVGVDLSDMFFGKNAKQDVVTDVKDNLWKYETGATGRDDNPKANTMALDIVTAKIQTGNALLLGKDRGYSVYGQRYSVESVMQDLLSINIGNVFNTTFNNNIQFFNRFDNVAIPDVVVNRPEEWDKDQFEF